MIAPLIERAARRAEQADAVYKSDETTSIHFRDGRPRRAETSRQEGINLRVVAEGRLGIAGATSADDDTLLEAALASAQAGDPVALVLPGPSPLPAVSTHAPRAAAADATDLVRLGTLVRDRLAGQPVELALTVSRSLGSVRVANTRGLDAGYDVTLAVLRVEASLLKDGRRVTLREELTGADLPTLAEIEAMVTGIRRRLAWMERADEAPGGRVRVAFLPHAVPLLLTPVEQALLGKTVLDGLSPLASRRGSQVYSTGLTVTDDPLVPGRPGSRPVDDEGVPSCPLALVRAGCAEALAYDLETAGRVGATPTGHGRRASFGKPQPACTNVLLEPGEASWEEILAATGDGLLLEEPRMAWSGHVAGGTFAVPATVAWRVRGGEVTGLVPEVTVAGNAHDLLARLVALGREPVWVGGRSLPAVVVDGVSVF